MLSCSGHFTVATAGGMLLITAAVSLLATAQPAPPSEITACDTCTDPAVQKTGWWHGVGLNCPTGGDGGECDICTAKFGNSPAVISACSTAQTEEDCCKLCTMWNAGLLPGGLAPGNTKPCTVWYFRKEAAGGWCGLKDCAGPGACGPAASGENMVSGPACGTKAVGWTFVSLMLGAAFVYVGGGFLYAWKVSGQTLSFPQSHPQYAMWRNIEGLVMDGIAFASSGGQRRRRSGPSRSAESRRELDGSGASSGTSESLLPEAPQTETKKKRKKDKKGGAGAGGSGTKLDSGGRAMAGSNPSTAAAHTSQTAKQQQSEDAMGQRATPSAGGGRWVHVPT